MDFILGLPRNKMGMTQSRLWLTDTLR